MRRMIKILSVLLSVQLVVVGGYYLVNQSANQGTEKAQLIAFKAGEVNTLVVSSSDKQLKLQKDGEQWVIPDYYNFPVSRVKVEQLLEQLANVKPSWPVATTQSAMKRFKVDEKVFERKLQFTGVSGQQHTLYLGTTPSFKKVHARTESDGNIYAIPFSAHEASVKPEDWLDHALLYVPEAELQAVELPNLQLIKADEQFVVKDLPEDKKVDEAKLKTLLFKVSHLTFEGVEGKASSSEIALGQPVMQLSFNLDQGKKIDYAFYQPEKANYYLLKTSAHDYIFKLNKKFVEDLKQVQLEKLLSAEVKTEITDPSEIDAS